MSSLGSPTDRPPMAKPWKPMFQRRLRSVAQVLVHAALDDAEEGVLVLEAIELVARALPSAATGASTGSLCREWRVGRAFVEDHRDVRVPGCSDLHRDLGREGREFALSIGPSFTPSSLDVA